MAWSPRIRVIIELPVSTSQVREVTGIVAADSDEKHDAKKDSRQGIVADITFTTDLPVRHTEAIFILSTTNFAFVVPIPSSSYNRENVWRMTMAVPVDTPPQSPSTEYLQGLVDGCGLGLIPASALGETWRMRIEKTLWASSFVEDTKIATKQFERMNGSGGVVVIIGGAAPKIPFTGIQGINLRLRDAIALGPVLATHLSESTHRLSPLNDPKLAAPLQAWADRPYERGRTIPQMVTSIMKDDLDRIALAEVENSISNIWTKAKDSVRWLGDAVDRTKRAASGKLTGLKED